LPSPKFTDNCALPVTNRSVSGRRNALCPLLPSDLRSRFLG